MAKNAICVRSLRAEDVYWPNWIARTGSKFRKEHFSQNKLVSFSTGNNTVLASKRFFPNVNLLLEFVRYFDVRWKSASQNAFESECEAIPGEDSAGLHHADEKDRSSLS